MCYAQPMTRPRKPYPTLKDYARVMEREAALAEQRADVLGLAADMAEEDGDPIRAKAMRNICRKFRVQAILDRCRAVAAEARARASK